MENPSGRLTRWSILLSPFRYEVKHRPGKSNANADALSRPVLFVGGTIERNDLEINSAKAQDPYEDSCLMHFLQTKRHVSGASKSQVKRVEALSNIYRLDDTGTIYARKNSSFDFTIKVPKPEERFEILAREHELTHAKVERMVKNLSEKSIHWKSISKDAHQLVNSCDICLKYDKIRLVNNPATAISIDNIFDRLSMDVVSGLPRTAEGYHAIFVIVEYLTKFAWAFPLKHKSAEEIATHLMGFICTFGPPNCLLSDQGKEFLNIIVKTLCEKFQIIRRTTSSYNPRANGLCEKSNQTLVRMLIKHAEENPENWPEILNIVLLAYRTSVHSSTNYTPYHLMFGRRFGQFDDWIVKSKQIDEQAVERRLIELKKLFEINHEDALNNIYHNQTKQVVRQNKQTNSSHDNLKIGETVYIKNCKLVKSKFEPEYVGTFTIAGQKPSGNYIIEDTDGNILAETFPRWKIKPCTNFPEIKANDQPDEAIKQTVEQEKANTAATNSVADPKQHDAMANQKTSESTQAAVGAYEIKRAQKIGRGYRYQIQHPNGKSEWIPGSSIDEKALQAFQIATSGRANRKASAPTLLTLIALIGLILHAADACIINDKFVYCQTKELSRIVNPNPNCRQPTAVAPRDSYMPVVNFTMPSSVHIVSKNRYYLNEIGYQCFKTRRTTSLNETWYFKASRSEQNEKVEMSRLECLTMVESKMCDNNKMDCDNDGCWFNAKPIEVYYWNYNSVYVQIECAFVKKQIVAETAESQLYFSPLNECKPASLYCKLYDSIIVWSNDTRPSCLYTIVHTGQGYADTWGNFVYSDKDQLTFQVTKSIRECGVRMFETTSDFLIIFENDQEASEHKSIPETSSKISFNKQHDINNMMLAEADYEKYREYIKIKSLKEIDRLHECNQLSHMLKQIARDEDEFNEIHDLDGNKLTVYTQNGIIFLPFCTPVDTIEIAHKDKCYDDIPVRYHTRLLGQGKGSPTYRQGYLSKSNIIRDDSVEISCKLVHQSQILPSTQWMLIRRGNSTRPVNISHAIMHDLSQSSVQNDDLNLNHHQEVISNYQANQPQIEFQRKEHNDDSGGFYSLPNDVPIRNSEFQSRTQEELKSMNTSLLTYLASFTIADSILGTVTTLCIAYIIFQIALAIIAHCRSNDEQAPRAIILPPNEQAVLRNYETDLQKANEARANEIRTKRLYPNIVINEEKADRSAQSDDVTAEAQSSLA